MDSYEGIDLRGYERSDLDTMFHLDEVCFEDPFRFSKTDMRRFAEARNAHTLLAVQGGQLAGFSIVHVERSRGELLGYLTTLDVAPAFRRRGLARRLMQAAEEQACAVGCAAMLLHVFTGNHAAIAFYGKLGYERLNLATGFYRPGLSAWTYRKAFVAPKTETSLEQ